jgi:glycosyltransferase involved in cell wall biosynthesis
MRVLLLAPHPFFQPRGTPIAERMMLEVLIAAGHQVDVLTFPEGDDPGVPGCRVHRVPRLPFLRGVQPGFSLRKLIGDAAMLLRFLPMIRRRRRYDLVHAVEESTFIALLGRLLFRVPYVYDMDSGLARQMVDKFPPLARVRRLLDACEARAVRRSAGTLAVCRSLEEHARACDPGGLVACLEDVSLLAQTRDEHEEIDDLPDGGAPLVMYVGNLQRYQGIDLLLESFRRALAEAPEALLVVIGGDGESLAHYRARGAELGIAESVRWLGPRPVERLGSYLRRATVLVSPRIHGDNTPMKVYSYLDSGRPLLATRLPTHTQVLDDEVAKLADPEPEAMGSALAELLRDGALRTRLAANARELARREYTPEAFRGKLLRFYGSIEERIREERRIHGESARLQAGHQGHR